MRTIRVALTNKKKNAEKEGFATHTQKQCSRFVKIAYSSITRYLIIHNSFAKKRPAGKGMGRGERMCLRVTPIQINKSRSHAKKMGFLRNSAIGWTIFVKIRHKHISDPLLHECGTVASKLPAYFKTESNFVCFYIDYETVLLFSNENFLFFQFWKIF